jgi:hypothetical protein
VAVAEVVAADQQVALAHAGREARRVVGHGQRGQLLHVGDLDVAHADDEVDVVVVFLEDPGRAAVQVREAHASAPAAPSTASAR